MVPQEHLTWNHEDPPKVHVPYSQFTLVHNTTPRGLHMARHPLPHQDYIHTRYLGNKIPHLNNGHATYGSIHMHEERG